MFRFTQASIARAAVAAAAVALFASHTAFAMQPKEVSYWADAQTASRAGDRAYGADAQQLASRAYQNSTVQLASQAGDRKEGARAES
jgi:hypothetical protein